MDPIVGRIYRRQEYQQPWWLTALGIFGSMVGLLYFAFVSLQAGQAVWGGYSGIAPPRQQYIGHLTAMAMGLPWLSWSYWRWRERLFLSPAMRDLVTTPATPWQVLRIATRFNGIVGYLYSIAFVLFLFPWYRGEWLLLITATKFSTHWVIPLAFISAAVAALLISTLNAAIGISLNIFTSAIGFGGVAARFRNVERAMLILKRPIFYTLLMGLGLMLIVALVGIAPYSVPAFSNSSIWSLGQSLNRYFERPDTIAHAIMVNFPTVVWFDAMTHSTNGNADIFRYGIQGCIAWLAGAALLSGVFLNRGLSMSVRAGWYGVPDPTPADASKPQPRSFDPDRSNGPLEAWLLNRIGRMGRATLRLMAQNFEAGSIDMHLKRSVLLAAPCIAIGYAAKYLVPEALEIPLQLFNNATLGPEKEPIGLGAAAMCVVFMGLYRMQLWSTWRAAGSMLSYTPRQSAWQLQGFQFRRAPVVVTRGDARHPACEVYAVGLKDAVLLPTFYTVAWLLPVIGISALEALAVGLPPANVGWTFIIALPALAQVYYLGILVSMISYWMDYSRSRVIVFFKGIAFGAVFGSLISGLAVLIAYLCTQCIEHNRPAVAWLGCINITLVFDVALYSFFRWVYIRRRFDAERMQPRTMV